MLLFPLYTTLKDKCVLVIGGGDVAERKIKLMLKAHADIRVVSPVFTDTLESLGKSQQIQLIRQDFEPDCLDEAWFVIAATDQVSVNTHIAHAAHARKLFVNVVDDPILSTVHIPAIVDRSPLMISISSSGSAPMIARHVRERIEALIDNSMGQLTALAHSYRDQIRQQRPCLSARRQFYEWLIRGPVLQYIRNGDNAAATRCLETALQHAHIPLAGQTTHITIISDDPGDITLHTLRALNQADCIFHDDRIHADILDFARRDADRYSFTIADPFFEARIPAPIRQQLSAHVRAGKNNVLLTRAIPHPVDTARQEHYPYSNPSHACDTPEKQSTGVSVIS